MNSGADPAIDLDRLVDGFSREAFQRKAAWFVGAGASRPSGLVGWVDLLTPLGKEIGIRVTEDDDLPAVAQYYINRTSGNRGPLIQHVKNVLGSQVRPSVYHHHLARSNVGTIWTTNYDRLIEEALALAGVRSRVRSRKSDMVEPATSDAVGGVPGIESTVEAVRSSRVAARVIDLDRRGPTAKDRRIVEQRSTNYTCVAGRQVPACSRCGDACPL